MNEKQALDQIDEGVGCGRMRRERGHGGPGIPPMPNTDSQSAKTKAAIEKEAAELDEMNRAARERLLGGMAA